MQGEALKAIRNELGITQSELAGALDLTPQFIGMMERGEKAIEKRTAMAVRQLFNEQSRLYGSHEPGDYAGDIPLADAMIIWDHEDSATRPRIKVVAHGKDDRAYSSSFGACNSDWQRADTTGRLLRLFSRIPEWTMVEGLTPAEVHDALWIIPEYRASVCHVFAIRKGEADD